MVAGRQLALAACFAIGTRKHLQVLEDAGLVRRKKVGRTVWCTVVPDTVDPALTYLQQVRDFWTTQLDSMATSLGK